MNIPSFPFSTTDFTDIEPTMHNGVTGFAEWRTLIKDDIRIRLVKYSPGYFADHWCSKGHVIFCVDGEMETELQDGRKFILKKGMVYTVGDNIDAHRSKTQNGCTLFIVD